MTGLVIHEWMEKAGGAEKVVQSMLKSFPDADLYCLWNDAEDTLGRNIQESWLARTKLRKHKALALLAMPAIWQNLRFNEEYEWALISSHLFAHQATLTGVNSATRKYVYVHTPARYIWTPELDARGQGLPARLLSPGLRALDRTRAQGNQRVAANSDFVRQRIEATWGIESRVIYPPVDVERITSKGNWADQIDESHRDVLDALPEEFILGASRFVPYKRLDWVISAGEAANVAVVIAGAGPEEQRLRLQAAGAKVPVTFLISPPDELLFALYQSALAYIFPPIEDFGIMPVEAMAAGAPVVVNHQGGAAESVINGQTGVHLESFSGQEITDAIHAASNMDRSQIRGRSQEFSEERFMTQIQEWIAE